MTERCGRRGAALVLMSGTALAMALTGCSTTTSLNGTASAAITAPATVDPTGTMTRVYEQPVTTPPAPATHTVRPVTTTSAPGQFADARQLWLSGADAISAQQGGYWTRAAAILTDAANSGESGTAGFAHAAHELTDLAALPDAMLTAAQQTEETNLVGGLNTFFHTPGLYS